MLARIKIYRVFVFLLSCWLHLQHLFELASGVSIFAWAAEPDFVYISSKSMTSKARACQN